MLPQHIGLIRAPEKLSALAPHEWEAFVVDVLGSLLAFLGEPHHRRDRVQFDPSAPAFTVRISSSPQRSRVASKWCCVLTGNVCGDDRFHMSAFVLLFHEKTGQRLTTKDGRTYLRYQFDADEPELWKEVGWSEDEWGEWDSYDRPW